VEGFVVRPLVLLLAGLALVATAVGTFAWAWSHASTARSLYLFEGEDPTETVLGTPYRGAGPLGLDLVRFDDGRVVEVVRQGEPRAQWPRPEYLVGEHGARLADEPPSEGAWIPFAARATGASLLGLLLAAAAVPLLWSGYRRFGTAVFGQRDANAEPVTLVPGSGTHGLGQVPPYVPYNPDWDPDRRIR
jgi:hypothetical protein